MTDKTKSFPSLPERHWWNLRKQFKKSIPGTVTTSYLAAILNMKEISARANILPSLERLGIIDDQGQTLERARQWRDDTQYAAVCKEMLEEIYPKELIDATPEQDSNSEAASRWFALNTGAGQNAVQKMSSLYAVLLKADPYSERASTNPRNSSRKKTSSTKTSVNTRNNKLDPSKTKNSNADNPSIHINVQVHISSDSTPDQIDQIFSSMAKHIYQQE